jgi:hypothetical protein
MSCRRYLNLPKGSGKKEQIFSTGLQFGAVFLESSLFLLLRPVGVLIVFVDKYIIYPRTH